MDGKWIFNECEEGLWNHEQFKTKEEAEEAAREYFCEDQPFMYIGRCKNIPLPTYVGVEEIMERIDESYSQECFEWEDSLFDGVKKEDFEWLEEKMGDLMLEFYERTGITSPCHTIIDIQKITENQA